MPKHTTILEHQDAWCRLQQIMSVCSQRTSNSCSVSISVRYHAYWLRWLATQLPRTFGHPITNRQTLEPLSSENPIKCFFFQTTRQSIAPFCIIELYCTLYFYIYLVLTQVENCMNKFGIFYENWSHGVGMFKRFAKTSMHGLIHISTVFLWFSMFIRHNIHFEMFANSWLSVTCKENMSLPWLKKSMSSANNMGEDEVQTLARSFI